MELDKIKELFKLMKESDLTEISLKEGVDEISLKRSFHENLGESHVDIPQNKNLEDEAQENEENLYIYSPIVGTFYSSSAPDAPPFVKIGDKVKAGQQVCLIEAMKLMNEIESEFDAEIEAVLVSNEQKVEYGQPLFKVKRI